MPGERVILGLSGGVDSSVAALLLLEQGYEVEAVFMKNWEEDDSAEYCAAAEDLADARAVAERLGIRLHTVNFSAEYWDRVFEYFLAEYRAGRTPNPDIMCNREIKFRAFLDHARSLGSERIATGHYARLAHSGHRVRLLKGADPAKDQSYFLHALSQHQLAHAMFPLGELTKAQVRKRAQNAGLITHDKKDSTGICFIGERRFDDFLSRYLPADPGDIETPSGEVLGRHQGLMYYTIGQRHGLGIGGIRGEGEQPWYVAAKDLDRNALIVVPGHDHPLLYSPGLEASQLTWCTDAGPALPLSCRAKIRYRQADQPCRVEAAGAGRCRVIFDRPQRAVAPGQSVVFYDGEECLGGGIIDRAIDQSKQPLALGGAG
jgi:tRNA-specific 2-thiouridylase